MTYRVRGPCVAALMTAAIAISANAAFAHGGSGSHGGASHAGNTAAVGAAMVSMPASTSAGGPASIQTGALPSATASAGKSSPTGGASACGKSQACATALSGSQSAATTAASSTVPPAPPFDAAAPAAPPAMTAPVAAALAPLDPVSTESGGSSRQPDYGAGGPTLASCMAIWEPVLDMTKAEWKATCVRTLNGVDLPASGSQVAQHPTRRTAHIGHGTRPTSSLVSSVADR